MLSYLLNWLGVATTFELDALYHRAEAAERGLARVQVRLGELEALHTAAPEQVGVDTLVTRVQLGKHAEAELLRTLGPWRQVGGSTSNSVRESLGDGKIKAILQWGTDTYRIHVEGYGTPLYWRLGTLDREEALQRADAFLCVAGYRLGDLS